MKKKIKIYKYVQLFSLPKISNYIIMDTLHFIKFSRLKKIKKHPFEVLSMKF